MFVSDRRWPQLGWPARGPWLLPIYASSISDATVPVSSRPAHAEVSQLGLY